VTYAKSGLFWSQCFLPSLVIRKAQAGAGKSSLGLLWYDWLKPKWWPIECCLAGIKYPCITQELKNY
jgi:hypothetical protein